jgi:integrase/recombinase XerD
MSQAERVRVLGPLAALKDGFVVELERLGYSEQIAAEHVRLLNHLSQQVEREGLGGKITPDAFTRLAAWRRESGYTHRRTEQALVPLASYLRRLGVAVPPDAAPASPTDDLLNSYRVYLRAERGLAEQTVDRCLRTARQFLAAHGRRGGGLRFDRLTSAEVSAFVLAESRRRRRGSAKLVITELRSLLRFLHVQGLTPESLVAAVPALAGWRLSGLPKALPPASVERLLASCDRTRVVGKRDFAIVTIMARLGLRRSEVAALRLAEIDWRAGELIIRGKRSTRDRLPLPSDVGEALVDYLRCPRPCESGHVFLRVRAPQGPMTPGAVSAAVGDAGRRAGLPGHLGSHQLRHTAATEMLRAGAQLREIGQVLRHRSTLTTAIYTKVDFAALRPLARGWPAGAGDSSEALRPIARCWPGGAR